MSTQEYFEDNSLQIDEQKIGHLDLYAQDIYCRNLNVLNPAQAGLVLCGMVLPYYIFSSAQPLVPPGYGVCNGGTYPSLTYPGVNIFSPDLRNNFLRGGSSTDTVYATPEYTGSNTTTLVAGNIPQLSFQCSLSDGFSLGANVVASNVIAPQSPPTQPVNTITIGGPTPSPFSNTPLSASCVYIIKL